MDKQEFVKGINKLELAYNQKFTAEKLRLWWNKLSEMEATKYLERIDRLIETNQYMPNVAEILDKKKTLSNFEQRDYSNYDFSKLYKNFRLD